MHRPAQGQRYGELFKFFPEATVMGLFEPRHRSVRINPDPDALVGPSDELVLMRPTCAALAEYQPLDVPVLTDPGEGHPPQAVTHALSASFAPVLD